MLGAIAGDIIGSRYEWNEFQGKKSPLFTGACHYTDESLMTLAIGEAFMMRKDGYRESDFQQFVISRMVKTGRRHQASS